jgi:hypothetical protein
VKARRALAACFALALATCPGALAAEPRLPTAAPLALHGFSGQETTLSRLDPVSLAPRDPQTVVPEWHNGYDIAPDGRQAVFTVSSNGLPSTPGTGRVGVRVVDLTTMQAAVEFRTGVAASALAWLSPRRIVAHVQGGRVFLLDPATGAARMTGTTATDCIDPPGKGSTARLLVMALGRKLSTVDKHGRVRSVSLPGMDDECFRPGFALDRGRNRAYVFDDGRRAAEVDLHRMRAGFTAMPDLDANGVAYTKGLLLGEDRVAAAHENRRGMPRGVEVIDFARHTRRLIDPAAGQAVLAGSLLLAFDGRFPVSPGGSTGLRAFGRDGRLRFRVLTSEVVHRVHVLGRYAYVLTRGGLRVVDLRTRKVVSRSPFDPDVEIDFLHAVQ